MGDVTAGTRVGSATRTRMVSMLVYTVALTTWVVVVGHPRQTLLVFAWIWLALVAWNFGAPWRDHLEFPRDWWPALAVLTVYMYSRGLANDLGFASVHVTEPVDVDRWLFGGVLPTEYLQARLCGVPCRQSLPPHWYDGLLTTVYYSHFLVALVTAAVLWTRHRPHWVRFMRRYLSLCIVGLAVYVTYPMAPPWMAARQGVISGDVARITGRGWSYLGSGGDFHHRISALGNPVAAMPSLHAGVALLVAAYGVLHLRSRWRWTLLLYPVVMGFMLVYYAEHYVVDVLAGFVAATAVLWVCSAWERRADGAPFTARVGKRELALLLSGFIRRPADAAEQLPPSQPGPVEPWARPEGFEPPTF